MMQKVLIRVTITDPKKSRTKALKIAATVYGVESVALKGDAKDQIEVVGEGIDTVELAKLLRKKVGGADLLSVGPAKEEKKAEKPPEGSKNETPIPQVVWGSFPYPPAYPVWEVRDQEPSCSIM